MQSPLALCSLLILLAGCAEVAAPSHAPRATDLASLAAEMNPAPWHFTLDAPTNFVAGASVTLQVGPAEPGAAMYFAYGTSGLGPGACPPLLQGLCMDFRSPVHLLPGGPVTVGPDGFATRTLTLPPQAGGSYITIQAAEATGEAQISNTIARLIAPVGTVIHPTADFDGDGVTAQDGDCADFSTRFRPGLSDRRGNGYDENCDDVDGVDHDHDGFASAASAGTDCDDNDPSVHPGGAEVCNGQDDDCDGTTDSGLAGSEAMCAAESCRDVLALRPGAPDDLYWIQPPGHEALELWCDMASGGWTLVYHATNSGGVIEHGEVTGPGPIGTTPFTTADSGHFKLDDAFINALRSSAVANDLRVIVYDGGAEIGRAFHPSACTLQSGSQLDASHVCNASTRVGPDDTTYQQSGHPGSLNRWYADGGLGYLWGATSWGTHIGPVPGGHSHGGALPDPFCTWYDSRTCPRPSSFDIWAW